MNIYIIGYSAFYILLEAAIWFISQPVMVPMQCAVLRFRFIFQEIICDTIPDSKVHGANMGPTWVLSAPDGPHVSPHEPCYQGCLVPQLLATDQRTMSRYPMASITWSILLDNPYVAMILLRDVSLHLEISTNNLPCQIISVGLSSTNDGTPLAKMGEI